MSAVLVEDAPMAFCESCGLPADVRLLTDGSTWCIGCDMAAREAGHDNAPAEMIGLVL